MKGRGVKEKRLLPAAKERRKRKKKTAGLWQKKGLGVTMFRGGRARIKG